MADAFSVAFEQVELVDGLEENQLVWLFMRGTLFKEGDLETALRVEEVGSLPPDANRQLEGMPQGNAGLYANGLPIGQAVRNDRVRSDTGQSYAAFALNPIEVGPGEVLELLVIMLPRVWFKTITVPPDEVDRWTSTAFGTLLGASGFGLIGAAAGAIVGFLFGNSDQDVEVPCLQSVITARHVFTHDELLALRSEGQRRFGPRDNDLSPVCGEIDSYYWLSVDRYQPWSFGPVRPIEAGDCSLLPFKRFPVETWLQGIWLDGEEWTVSCVGAVVDVISEDAASVHLYDQPSQSSVPPRHFERCPITVAIPDPDFAGNRYDGRCPPRSVAPICPNCRRFTNLPAQLIVSPFMMATLALGSRHVGAEPWAYSLKPAPAAPRPAAHGCGEERRLRNLELERSASLETRSLGRGMLFRKLANGDLEFWPKGTPPRPPKLGDRAPAQRVEEFLRRDFLDKIGGVNGVLWGCFKIELNQREILYSYAEVPASGTPLCPRLRYLKLGTDGGVVMDVMLQAYTAPPR